jgi:hypothetical protein
MYETIPKNSTVAALRRTFFTLVSSTDYVTPINLGSVTGVKATLSFGGAAPAASTNDIVKVDGAAGEYYVELTQAESNTALGQGRLWLTPTGCMLCKAQFTIGPAESYDSPATVTDIATGVGARSMGANFQSKDFDTCFKALFAMVAGVMTGGGTTTEVFKDPNGTATVVTVVNDGTNRTTITIA